jgi:hypothetical protein
VLGRGRYLARFLGETAIGASRTDTFLGLRYRRIARRRSKNRAIVAIGRSILIIVWRLLSDPETRFHDVSRADLTRRVRRGYGGQADDHLGETVCADRPGEVTHS